MDTKIHKLYCILLKICLSNYSVVLNGKLKARKKFWSHCTLFAVVFIVQYITRAASDRSITASVPLNSLCDLVMNSHAGEREF